MTQEISWSGFISGYIQVLTNCCETFRIFHVIPIGCVSVDKDSSWCFSGTDAFCYSSETKTPFPRHPLISRASNSLAVVMHYPFNEESKLGEGI